MPSALTGQRPATATTAVPPRSRDRRPGRVVLVLALATVAAGAAFLTLDVTGSWSYALELRAKKLLGLGLVGFAVAYSTVLFQTVTGNRILTPSIMGFDSLYVLIQSVMVYALGSLWIVQVRPEVLFALEVAVMVAFAGALYRWLFGRRQRDVYVLVLSGVVFGTLFTSLSSLVGRLIDPNEFITLQDRLFASFGSLDQELLLVSAVAVAAVSAYGYHLGRYLDVLALGRDHAIGLGVEHRRVVNRILVVVAILVSVATALVGPITFFGLLVANLAHQVVGTFRHRYVVPAACLFGVLALIGGQLLLERIFEFNTSLSILINFVGGVYFIALLLREAKR